MEPQIITKQTEVVRDLMPPYEEIPDEFKNPFGNNKWARLTSDWFFYGIKDAAFKPKDGIDTDMALSHIMKILRSFEPRHEHKEAAVAYLLSQWFDDVEYTRNKI